MKNWETTLIGPDALLRDALEKIDKAGSRIVLVVDDNRKLIGTLSDGDVRRGLLRGLTLTDKASAATHANPAVAHQGEDRHAILATMRRLGLYQMPVVDAQGVVVGLETVDDFLVTPMANHWVVIMAGGRGTRLAPITETTPKPMIPVGGRPLLESIILNFVSQGFHRFFLAVNYKAELIREHFGDGSRFGVSIEYLHEQERKGTAGALSLLPGRPTEPIIVMNGDLLTTVNFRNVIDFHREHHADATMCVREHVFQIPFGVVETEDFKLKILAEKPVRSCLVNAGIYLLNPEVLDLIPADRLYDMTELFSDLNALKREAAVFPLREYWLDIGRMEDLERASLEYPQIFS